MTDEQEQQDEPKKPGLMKRMWNKWWNYMTPNRCKKTLWVLVPFLFIYVIYIIPMIILWSVMP